MTALELALVYGNVGVVGLGLGLVLLSIIAVKALRS